MLFGWPLLEGRLGLLEQASHVAQATPATNWRHLTLASMIGAQFADLSISLAAMIQDKSIARILENVWWTSIDTLPVGAMIAEQQANHAATATCVSLALHATQESASVKWNENREQAMRDERTIEMTIWQLTVI